MDIPGEAAGQGQRDEHPDVCNLAPCELTADGWCATHSTGAGPVYCQAP